MSLRKLKGIRSVGAYTAEKGIVEKLLLIENNMINNEMLRTEINLYLDIAEDRKLRKTMRETVLSQFREQKIIILTVTHEAFYEYLRTTTDTATHQAKTPVIDCLRGSYMSEIFHHLTGDQPFEIDLEKNPCNWLFCGLDNERPIIIRNIVGDFQFFHAGANQGRVVINAQNITGNNNFINAGSHYGYAIINARNTTGDGNFSRAGRNGYAIINTQNTQGNKNFRDTGLYQGHIVINAQSTVGNHNFESAGAQHGRATINAQNTTGDNNFCDVGKNGGKTIILAKEIYGNNNFDGNEGTLIISNENPLETRVEGVTDGQKEHILNLIAQNTPPEQIMNYLRRST